MFTIVRSRKLFYLMVILTVAFGAVTVSSAQTTQTEKTALGSKTAREGFKNETEIAVKFNNWRTDEDARAWLTVMNYKLGEIEAVAATKPHGAKADVVLRINTKTGETQQGISIKLVSSPNGFNQIDKRWLATYAKMWRMPADVHTALKLYVGETPPTKPSRNPKRMFINELDAATRQAIVDFFTANKDEIVSDFFAGDGSLAAGWVMVAFKATEQPRWIIRSTADTIKFFSEGKVEITRAGNLKIGRVTMQRKGGDGGRETAKMLQFKFNPVQLFDAK